MTLSLPRTPYHVTVSLRQSPFNPFSFRQFLVDNKYAAPGKVAINGGSNGGAYASLLISRQMLILLPYLLLCLFHETTPSFAPATHRGNGQAFSSQRASTAPQRVSWEQRLPTWVCSTFSR